MDSEEESNQDEEDSTFIVTENACQFKAVGYIPKGSPDCIDIDINSLDYDVDNSWIANESLWRFPTSVSVVRREMTIIFLHIVIGCLTGILASLISMAIEVISAIKYEFIANYFNNMYNERKLMIYPLLMWQGISIVASICAAVPVVYFSPVAAGSGIPLIKCYLNGIAVPRLMRVQTLCVKAMGVVFSVVAGLAVGKEGPMIHSGGCIAAGITQCKSTSLGFDLGCLHEFRFDHLKRDFVGAGAAAGVSAAFGSPIGGVIFAIEEGVSYLRVDLIFKICISSITSYLTFNYISTLRLNDAGHLSSCGLIDFGTFDDADYSIYQIPVFMLMGIIGGALGAFWNQINKKLTQFRIRYIRLKCLKVLEVVMVALAIVFTGWIMMYFLNDCKSSDHYPTKHPVQLGCADGKYSTIAAIWFQTPEQACRHLFHDPIGSHSMTALVLFMILYYVLSVWTYGLSISAGLFIPALLIGAVWGRMFGTILMRAFPNVMWGDIGKYALIGGAANLSGVVRMTISVTCIMLEATGNYTYAFPIFVTIFVAKYVGDIFNEGLYDIHINLAGLPLLQWQPAVGADGQNIKTLMASPVACLNIRSRVADVVRLLTTTQHHGFPVVDLITESNSEHNGLSTFGKFRGLVLRHDLVTLLRHRMWDDTPDHHPSYSMLRSYYPRWHGINDIVGISHRIQMTKFVDLHRLMNPSAPTICSTSSVGGVHRTFRKVGLRHLVITNERNEVVGMITRKDLARYHSHVKLSFNPIRFPFIGLQLHRHYKSFIKHIKTSHKNFTPKSSPEDA